MAIDDSPKYGATPVELEQVQEQEVEEGASPHDQNLDVSTHPEQVAQEQSTNPVGQLSVVSVGREEALQEFDPTQPAEDIFSNVQVKSGIGGVSQTDLADASKHEVKAIAAGNPDIKAEPFAPERIVESELRLGSIASAMSKYVDRALNDATPQTHALVEAMMIEVPFENRASAEFKKTYQPVIPRLGETFAELDPDLGAVARLAHQSLPTHVGKFDRHQFPSMQKFPLEDAPAVAMDLKRMKATVMDDFLGSNQGSTNAVIGKIKPTQSSTEVSKRWNDEFGERYRANVNAALAA